MTMIKKIKRKINDAMGISEHSWQESNWSYYRFFKFLTSARGQKKLWSFVWKICKYIIRKTTGINLTSPDYKKWLKKNTPSIVDLNRYRELEKSFTYRPKVSIILPVYDPPENFFIDAIESVINQVYTNWELCIADDVSPNENIRKIIEEYSKKDERIKYVFRTENGHISAASNSAIEIATGEYIGLLDHDDLLTPDALYENIKVLNSDKDIDLIYSDEDKVDEHGNLSDPHFKPDWCPDNFLSRNYICHFTVIKSSLVNMVGGFRIGFEGSQDYDIFLRVTDIAKKIHHIPKILYHWRMHLASTALNMEAKPYTIEAGIKAVEDTLKRRNIKGVVNSINGLPGFYQIKYDILKKDKVSIIIPTKNLTDVTNTCIQSIFELTDYPDFEVILVNNNSDEEVFFEMVKKWENKEPLRFKCITDNSSFNFSRLINFGIQNASGKYFLLLNNDTEVIQKDWMTSMVEQAQHSSTGVVGVKLLYKNDTIQHAGVVIGMGGIAAHAFTSIHKNEKGYFCYIQAINNFSAVTAACMMVSKEKYELVGGFDEELTVEYNDIDFCLKLKDKGFNNIYLPHVTLYHYESISRGHPHKTKESYERHLKEIGIFQNRWQKYIDHDPCYSPNLSKVFLDFRINTN